MRWVLAIVFSLFGLAFGQIGVAVTGFFGGLLLGWLAGVQFDHSRRLRELDQAAEHQRQENARLSLELAQMHARAKAAASTERATPDVEAPADTEPAPFVSETPREAANEARPTPAVAPVARISEPVTPLTQPAVTPAAIAATTTPSPASPAAATATSQAAPSSGPARPTAPPRRAPPRQEDAVTSTAWRWLTEGNLPVKIGMLLLFFGVAAALKYAADQGWFTFPIEYRLIGIAGAALVGLFIGWRQRDQRRVFALSLQGGAVGILLLTIFASFRLYGVLSSGSAFTLIVMLVAGTAFLAVLQNAAALAALGFFGGYLAPVMISTGSNDYVALFSYYAVLNAAVFFIALLRSWRALNLIGFAFTFAVGTAWGAKYYQPENFATVEPFLILFFLFYVGITVLYALRQPEERRGIVDGTLTFGVPLLAFPLQAAMLHDDRMGLAYSALAVAAFYGVLAAWLIRDRRAIVLGQSFGVLAVGFATLAVPLALSARWTATTWAIEGAALVWLGLRQQRSLPQVSGLLLQVLSAGAYLIHADEMWRRHTDELFVLNGHALSLGLMAFAGYVIAWLYERHAGHRALVWMAFLWGWLWWTLAGVREVAEFDEHVKGVVGLLGFFAMTAGLATVAARVMSWTMMHLKSYATVFIAIPMALLMTGMYGHPFAEHGGLAWLAWLIAVYAGMHAMRDGEVMGRGFAHIGVLAALACVGGLEMNYLVDRERGLGSAWQLLASFAPLALLLLGTTRAPRLFAWPFAETFESYAVGWRVLASVVLGSVWLFSQFHDGDATPIAYVSVLNPLELAQIAMLVWLARGVSSDGVGGVARGVLPYAAMLTVTMIALRGVHYYHGEPWGPGILDSRVAQTTLTVLWALLGVSAWVYGSRRGRWSVWLSGAIIMGVVLAKLILVDRSYIGDLAGIVSFIAVGLLLTAVGYFAPSPPRGAGAPQEETA